MVRIVYGTKSPAIVTAQLTENRHDLIKVVLTMFTFKIADLAAAPTN